MDLSGFLSTIQAKGLEVQTDPQDASCYSYDASNLESLPAAVIFVKHTQEVSTGCPACRMQISAGLRTYYREIPVYHPVVAMSFAQMEGNDGEKTGNTEEITEGQVWIKNGT